MKNLKHCPVFVLISFLSLIMINCEREDGLNEMTPRENSLKCGSNPTPDHYVTNHDGTITVYGPEYYFIPADGSSQVISSEIQIMNHDRFRENYVVFVKNGHGNGGGMVSSWKIKINGAVLYGSGDLEEGTIFSSEDIELPEGFNLEVELEGAPESYIRVIFYGELKENYFCDNRDGHIYKTVKIGDQVWMAENLGYLPVVYPPTNWPYFDPIYFVYGYNVHFSQDSLQYINEAKNTWMYKNMGALYNWTAAMEGCPQGWHLPSDEEWNELVNYLGGDRVAGYKLKSGVWYGPALASNESGFTARAGGMYGPPLHYENWNIFTNAGEKGYWWSSTTYSEKNARLRFMSTYYDYVYPWTFDKSCGLSVRCVKD